MRQQQHLLQMTSSTAASDEEHTTNFSKPQSRLQKATTITTFTTSSTPATQESTSDEYTADQQQQHATTTTNNIAPVPYPYPQWHNAAAGAVAGASARLATAPLDLIRIRAQLQREVEYPRPSLLKKLYTIYQQEGGFLALFRGSVAATYLWIGYSMVQFSVYGNIKGQLTELRQQSNNNNNNPLLTQTSIAFLSGAGAGLCATVSTYPFDICRTIFAAQGILDVNSSSSSGARGSSSSSVSTAAAFQPPKSLYECARRMYKYHGGISSFFVGVQPAMVQIIPYMGLNFTIYDALTKNDRSIGVSGYAGSISGATSKMLVYPMDTIKKRLQYQSVFGSTADSSARYSGMVDCFTTMLRKEGISSFYRGLVPSVLKTSIGSGLSFTFFRMTKNILEEVHDAYYS